MTLSDTPSVSLSDLMPAVSSYFGLNIGPAMREAESTAISIHNYYFLVSNFQGVGFSDVSGKPIKIPDPDRRPADLTYFTLRFAVSTVTVDIRALASSLSLEFSLRLPQSLSTSTSNYVAVIKTPTAPALIMTPPKPIEDLSFKLRKFSDDILFEMGLDEIQKHLIDARDTLYSSTPTLSIFVQPSTLFI